MDPNLGLLSLYTNFQTLGLYMDIKAAKNLIVQKVFIGPLDDTDGF